jgi:hypothetical protein
MSTQRRENRWQRISCTEFANGSGQLWFLFITWFVRAFAKVGTAPPQKAYWLSKAWTATNSLQSDHRTTQFVRQDFRRTSRSAPPFWAARIATIGTRATRRSSFTLIPSPTVLVPVHPFSPNNPAGKCRWTERYDGKRNLHFLNAA